MQADNLRNRDVRFVTVTLCITAVLIALIGKIDSIVRLLTGG